RRGVLLPLPAFFLLKGASLIIVVLHPFDDLPWGRLPRLGVMNHGVLWGTRCSNLFKFKLFLILVNHFPLRKPASF
ncbi:MAG: hypothetical protein ACD_28C00082G0001, partial [uncultured bacterium]